MRRATGLYRTSIGKKYTMAITAILLFLWIVGHLMGNLKIFLGPEHFNEYSVFLRTMGAPVFAESQVLWIVRLVIFAALLLHIVAYVQLWRRDAAARNTGYRRYDPELFSLASRTMKWGGITIFFFIVWHLLDLTFGTVNPAFVAGDPYHNVIATFGRWWVDVIYFLGVISLGLHLYHGTWSAMQTLGLNNPKYNRYRRPVAFVIAILITLGFASIPFAVLVGILR